MTLLMSVIGPLSNDIYGVGYQTPGCTSKTVLLMCRTEAQAIEESHRLNEEQEQRALKVQRDYELRYQPPGLAHVVDYLSDLIKPEGQI